MNSSDEKPVRPTVEQLRLDLRRLDWAVGLSVITPRSELRAPWSELPMMDCASCMGLAFIHPLRVTGLVRFVILVVLRALKNDRFDGDWSHSV
jgi:hypothetical protein